MKIFHGSQSLVSALTILAANITQHQMASFALRGSINDDLDSAATLQLGIVTVSRRLYAFRISSLAFLESSSRVSILIATNNL